MASVVDVMEEANTSSVQAALTMKDYEVIQSLRLSQLLSQSLIATEPVSEPEPGPEPIADSGHVDALCKLVPIVLPDGRQSFYG